MMRRVHGTLIKAITEEMAFEDSTFNERLQKGFPVVGQMENSVVGMFPNPEEHQDVQSMNNLWKNRTAFNEQAISIMKETEFS